jgi:electron transfer flavoprotein alpha/beta subunit
VSSINIAVLIKEVPDPEGAFSFDADGRAQVAHLPHVPSLFDENAVEAAVELKEQCGGRVVALSCGPAEAERTVRYAMAMGADEGVLVEDTERGWDSMGAACVLAAAVRRLGSFDVILCGREAADTGSGLVGPYVAQMLGISFLTLVTSIEASEGALDVRRLWEGGEDRFTCIPPVLLTVCAETNTPRYPSVLKVLAAKKRPLHRWNVDELAAAIPASPARLLGRCPAAAPGNCDFISGESGETLAGELLSRLREKKVV